jgi:GNAT superfamily N-acetyltransferase
MRYAKWEGGEDALSAARAVVDAFPLPPDLTLRRIDRSSPPALLAALAETALACGVLPLTGAVLRGLLQPSLCLVAVSEDGRVASCAAASAFAHPRHPRFGGEAWWGMLATEPARRGQRLALILGAHAMLEMAARFGYRRFMTGVEPGNAPSEALSHGPRAAPSRSSDAPIRRRCAAGA